MDLDSFKLLTYLNQCLILFHYFFTDATLELKDKYKRTVDEMEALKDHLGMRMPPHHQGNISV